MSGLVEIRKGKLWQRQEVERHLLDLLQPLDLLLEKTPFRLTDRFIPGHFGHVAIWMGTYQELDQLGIWQHEIFAEDRYKAYREMVREQGTRCSKRCVPGSELNTLEEFLNVDDLAVLRPVYLDQEEIPETLIRAFRQVGKAYDFNFEVETTDKIVCSELVYHVYLGVGWQTDQQLGRFTISPDPCSERGAGGFGAIETGRLLPRRPPHRGRRGPCAHAPTDATTLGPRALTTLTGSRKTQLVRDDLPQRARHLSGSWY